MRVWCCQGNTGVFLVNRKNNIKLLWLNVTTETLSKVCVSQITLRAKDPTYNLILAELEVKGVEN